MVTSHHVKVLTIDTKGQSNATKGQSNATKDATY